MTKLPEGVPTATVTLDKPRTLAFTLGSMRRVKAETGKSVQAVFAEIQKDSDSGVEYIGTLVWAMLINRDRDGLSRDDIEEMLHPGNLEEVSDAISHLAGERSAEGSEGNAPRRTRTKSKAKK